MSHLDIYSTSHGQKKGQDSRPLKVGNRPDPSVCRWSATHRWKALEESYKFASELVPIRGLSRELWVPKVPGVQFRTVLRLLLGSPGIKRHLDVGAAEHANNTIWGKVVASPEFRPWWVKWVRVPVAYSNTKAVSEGELTNLWLVFM